MQFFNPEIFWNTSVPLLTFSVLSDKKVSREIRDIPFLSTKLFDKRTFPKVEGVPYENFRYCEKIIFRQNRDTLSHAIILFQKFSDTKGPPYEFFWYSETKNFRNKIVIRLFCIKTFDSRNFLKHRVVPLRKFPALWDKNCSTVNNDNPHFPSKFPVPEIFWKTKSPPTKIFGTVRRTTRNFDKIVIHHLMHFF